MIVHTVPVAGAAGVKGGRNAALLIHGAIRNDAGDLIPLCSKVKASNLLDDGTQIDKHPISCKSCLSVLRRKK